MEEERYTAEQIHEENQLRLYCVICGDFIGGLSCPFCEKLAEQRGDLAPGESEEDDEAS